MLNKKASRLLLFPAGLAQKEAFLEAKKKNLHIISMDGNANAPCKNLADQFFHVDPANIPAALALIQSITQDQKLNGILLVGSDLPLTSAMAAKQCGLLGVELAAAKLTVDKYAMKKRLKLCGVPVPAFYKVVELSDIANYTENTPTKRFILKPNDNCGARGISIIQAKSQVETAYQRAWANRRGAPFIILEEYLDGPQISIEGITIGEVLHITGIADRNYDKIDLYPPYVIEDGADIPSNLSEAAIKEIKQVFAKAVKALGITNCVVKGDMVWSGEKAYVIEVAARISGGKFASRLVPEATGVNLLSIAIDACLGNTVNPERFLPSKNKFVSVRYFFLQPGTVAEVKGAEQLEQLDYIIDSSLPMAGQELGEITCHADRAGWIVCSGNSREESQSRVMKAMQTIKIIYK